MRNRTSCLKIFLLLLFLGCGELLLGVPARRGVINKTLPDGTTLSVRVYGDEWFHYVTTLDDYVIAQKEDGFYYYVDFSSLGERVITDVRVNEPGKRDLRELAFLSRRSKGVPAGVKRVARSRGVERRTQMSAQKTFTAKGSPKVLVVLAEFQDVKFTIPSPQQAFYDLANQEGYSANGGTGSVRDYYRDNSSGQFDPDFVVVGPYDLGKPMKYYGANNGSGSDIRPYEMVYDACQIASKNGVSFSQFDTDGDGILDNVFIYYAGYNEAELGPEESIWPHRHSVLSYGFVIDGVLLGDYACTSELRGWEGCEMAGIGTFCHEFGHVVGLVDLYDTDYDENGLCPGLFELSLMSDGNYNNKGRTPPNLSAWERYMVGWLEPEELTGRGHCLLPPISENKAYFYTTDVEGEIFMLENRQKGDGWDQYINGSGLLIYHIDRSDNWVSGIRAKDRWIRNVPNNIKDHPCMRLITANGVYSGNYSNAGMYYPGTMGVTTAEPKPWSGIKLGKGVSGISQEGTRISFDFYMAESAVLSGSVTNMAGKILSGARVTITPVTENAASGSGALFVRYAKNAQEGVLETTSDVAGNYTIKDIPVGKYMVEVEKEGYSRFSTITHVLLSENRLNILLQTPAETNAVELSQSKSDAIVGFLQNTSGQSPLYVANYWSTQELKNYENYSLKWVDLNVTSADALELKVWLDDECVLTKTLDNFDYGTLNRIYLGEQAVVIPANQTLKVGVCATGTAGKIDIPFTSSLSAQGGMVSTDGSTWTVEKNGCMILSAWLLESVWSTGVELEQSEIVVGILDSVKLKATVLPEDATNRKIVWSSADEKIARVTEDGVLVGLAEGTVTITATAADGKSSATCEVTVDQNFIQAADFKIGQREVRIAWEKSKEVESWLVRYKRKDDKNFREIKSDTTVFIINMLTPATVYEVEIIARESDTETGVLISKNFTTESIREEVASIAGIQRNWKAGDLYWPVVNNIQKDVRRIIWKLDGKVIVPTRDLVLPAGVHTLRAEVTTNDGITEILVRKINVQSKAN